jgi:hypothetical protein
VRESYEEARVQFVFTELDLAATFCELATSARNGRSFSRVDSRENRVALLTEMKPPQSWPARIQVL